MRAFCAWLTFFALLIPTPPLFAWGGEGHAIVADIAVDHLVPAARQTLEELLGNTDLASLSSWPDQIRSALPETAPWHYVDIPSTADGYLATRDCPQDNCVVAKILWFSKILSNPKQPRAAHILAIEFLVHLVGDIHQPFHALADARGGNDIPVTAFGAQQCGPYPCQLHALWDAELIEHTGMDERQYGQSLEKEILDEHLDAGPDDPVAWANASWKLAKDALVEPGASIDEAYYRRERPVIDQQLALAGLRLAHLLNQDLSDGWTIPATPSSAPAPAPTSIPKPN
jgi:S1/P1 Nuclease